MVATLALLFATTYELTQTLAPVALFVANYYLWNLRKDEVTSLNKIKSALLTKFNLVFLAFFSIPFLIIRIDSFAKCASGCYQAASLNPGGFSPGDFFSRTVSSIPTIAQVVGFGYETSWLESGFNLAALAGASTVSLIATLWLLNSFRKSDLPKKETLDVSGLKILALTGLAIILVISIGMALSVAVQTSQDKLSFGASSRDSLILSIGTDLLLSYIFAVCGIKIISSKEIKSATRTLLSVFMVTALSANFALTFVSNSIVTRATQNSAGAFMQGAIATAVSHPDTTAQGDQSRCSLVKQKILNFPEWEGHDRLLVNGLNQNFQTKTGGNFCSISIEELFENYPLK